MGEVPRPEPAYARASSRARRYRLQLMQYTDASLTGGAFLLAATLLTLPPFFIPGFVRWKPALAAIAVTLCVLAVIVLRLRAVSTTITFGLILLVDVLIVLGAASLADRGGSRLVAALFVLPSLYLGLYAAYWVMIPQAVAVTAGTVVILIAGGRFDATALSGTGSILVSVFTPAVAVQVLRYRLVAALRRAKALSTTDPLTGLANRRGIVEQAPAIVARARAGGLPFGVVLADVDHFKRINDRHGHAVGDEVLRQVAQAVRGCVRLSDVVVRLGGEEIAVLAALSVDDLADLAERIRLEVAQAAQPWPVTVSLGVAWADRQRLTGDPVALTWALVDEADDLMYAAKRAGRNRVTLPTLH
jgi:diguanylate cyclase (GGDEF)-like protein